MDYRRGARQVYGHAVSYTHLGADLNVKSVRIYNKALTSDEVLNNYIVDRNHLEDADGEPGVQMCIRDRGYAADGKFCGIQVRHELLAYRFCSHCHVQGQTRFKEYHTKRYL